MSSTIKITQIDLYKATNKTSSIKAFAKVTFGDPDAGITFTIHGARIIEGARGVFVGWPSRQSGDRYVDIITINNTAFREKLESKLIEMYSRGKFIETKKSNSDNYPNSQRPNSTADHANGQYDNRKPNKEDFDNSDDEDIFAN